MVAWTSLSYGRIDTEESNPYAAEVGCCVYSSFIK